MTSNVPEVQELAGELAKKVSASSAELNPEQIGRVRASPYCIICIILLIREFEVVTVSCILSESLKFFNIRRPSSLLLTSLLSDEYIYLCTAWFLKLSQSKSILHSHSIGQPSHKQAPILILSFHYFLSSFSFVLLNSSSTLLLPPPPFLLPLLAPVCSITRHCLILPAPVLIHLTTSHCISLLSFCCSVYSVFKAYRPLPPLLKRAL